MVETGGARRSLRVFISSTYEDLKPYVHAAEEALRDHVQVDWFKHWRATGRPSVAECRDHVRACDALVVLVGNTYGWVPGPEDGGDGRSSITRLEVRWAREKPMPVLPFFIHDPTHDAGDPSGEAAGLQREFVAELQAVLGTPVASLDGFGEAVRESVLAVADAEARADFARPARVGQRTQGICTRFLDRVEQTHRLHTALTGDGGRGAVIVGRAGLGKSALANQVIDQICAEGAIAQVVYLNSSTAKPIGEFALFMSTLAASGKEKAAYEGSWPVLNGNPERLVEVLMEVYRQHPILLLFDAFEHNLDDAGTIRSATLASFVTAFAGDTHHSKLLITSRFFPLFAAVEAEALPEIPLDHGLPTADGVALLVSQSPGAVQDREQIEAAIRAVDGIPFAVKRMADLLRQNRLLEIRNAIVHERTLDAFVELAHSTLTPHAHLTLQARAIFDEPVPVDALAYVLDELLAAPAVESAVEELGRGSFLFRVGSRLGIHELDQESSYRSIERDGTVDRRRLHHRAADYYARQCCDHDYWFEWSSYDDLRGDLKRFNHLVKAGQPLAAAEALSISKVEFLNYAGHAREIQGMFTGLDVGNEVTRGLLVTRYAVADCFAILGPFDRAIEELEAVIELARALGDARAESSASYELASAYRYAGRGEDAVALLRSVTDRLRETGEERLRAYYLYGHSLACSYIGLYAEAIRLGQDQVQYGRRSRTREFVSRGNSSLCLPYYVIGLPAEAAAAAAESCGDFTGTPRDYLVGYIENVHGLSLFALGRVAEAIDAFTRAVDAGRRTGQRRAEGLAAVNWAWVLYDGGDLSGAQMRIDNAIDVFEALLSGSDAKLAGHLRDAFDAALARNRHAEAGALWAFVASQDVNPDFVRRLTVAERILSLGDGVDAGTRALATAMVGETRQRLAAVRAELADS